MSLPMCKRLLAAHVHVKVFDINAQSIDSAVDYGATATKSVAECASQLMFCLHLCPDPIISKKFWLTVTHYKISNLAQFGLT